MGELFLTAQGLGGTGSNKNVELHLATQRNTLTLFIRLLGLS